MDYKYFSTEDFQELLKLYIEYYYEKREIENRKFVPKRIH